MTYDYYQISNKASPPTCSLRAWSPVRIPFGVAQIGKSFRNEVTPRNFIFRSREFEQMEMEWFCHPDEALRWYEFWKAKRMEW